jgi:pimeloyl-ACP methyl ester carboxylesterase
MECIERNVTIEQLSLQYFVFGEGETDVICLHGHGRTADDFSFIASHSKRVVSIHLFYHGSSKFPEERIESNPLQLSEFLHLFKQLLIQENISRFHLFAFSQGGRFSLCLTPTFAQRIITLTLIAPDGMDNQSFYNWSSRQKWARKLFVHWEKNPTKLHSISNLAVRLKLMRPKVGSFVKEFSSDQTSFIRASKTWRAFRDLKPNPTEIGNALVKYKIPFRIIMGKYDQVIRPKQAYAFEKKCGLRDTVIEVPNGHNFFKKSAINKFVDLLPFMDE